MRKARDPLTYWKTHGMSKTPIYNIWNSMRVRCYNKSCKAYRYYGGRGIRVCERWQTFEGFFSDMGHRPDGCSLDRIDNNGDYCPENCRWANVYVQMRNRRGTVPVTINGITKTMSEWCKISGISMSAANKRVKKFGWTIEMAVSVPPKKQTLTTITIDGVVMTLAEASSLYSMTKHRLVGRLKRGWTHRQSVGLDSPP